MSGWSIFAAFIASTNWFTAKRTRRSFVESGTSAGNPKNKTGSLGHTDAKLVSCA